jgi:hypothetical protein
MRIRKQIAAATIFIRRGFWFGGEGWECVREYILLWQQLRSKCPFQKPVLSSKVNSIEGDYGRASVGIDRSAKWREPDSKNRTIFAKLYSESEIVRLPGQIENPRQMS